MKASTLLLALGLCLATGISAEVLGSTDFSVGHTLPRFSRLLKQEAVVASYLLPSEPTLCTPTPTQRCCQTDSYTSPYVVISLNHTQQTIGDRWYSTFYYSLSGLKNCRSDIDPNGCCSASVDTVWMDVDPALKVKYVSVNGENDELVTSQSQFGLKIGNLNKQLSQIPRDTVNDGLLVSVTVEGYVDQLCPTPDLAPVPGICEVLLVGGSSAGPSACCPLTLTQETAVSWTPSANDGFHCTSDLGRSGFRMTLDEVSPVFVGDAGRQYINYTFNIRANDACVGSGSIGSCCDVTLTYVELKITDQSVTNVHVDGMTMPYRLSNWNEPSSTSYRSLIVENLNYVASDLGSAGAPLVVTMRVASVNAMPPDLCDASSDPGVGACHYYLHSDEGLCCPSGLAAASVVPPPPPGTCAPTQAVAASDASMSLQLYDKGESSSSTTWTFLLADHNGAGACTKAYCRDVCSWSLYIRPDVATSVVVGHENAADNGRVIIAPGATQGAAASITFTYGPTGEGALNFFVTLPAASGTALADLCAPSAVPGQGTKACAAVVRSADVYIIVYFSEGDIIISPTPPPTTATPSPGPVIEPPPGMCEAPLPMDRSCLRAVAARYNANSRSTTFAVSTALAGAQTSCQRPSAAANDAVSFRLYLKAEVVDELLMRKKVTPSAGLALNRAAGAEWTVSQGAGATYVFNLKGRRALTDVCRQRTAPDQPAGSCAVEVSGRTSCFRAYLMPSHDGTLIWVEASRSDKPDAAVIVPAVVIPIVGVAVILAVAALYYRRRQRQRYSPASLRSDSGGLERPLTANSHDGTNGGPVAPHDVQIRVPGASAGGAPRR